ncbi:MAG: tRNA (guanosine(46)-N7)-methyltransferase TrmB [Candidatus Competibacterales bacterium]
MIDTDYQRPVRSFVRREGRLTTGQKSALERLWGHYGIDFDPASPALVETPWHNFAPPGEWILEIGFGDGESLMAQAQGETQRLFIGVEVHRPGVGHLLMGLEAQGIPNVRVICADAAAVVPHLPAEGFARVQIFFPDPWPKKRHHKRRLIQPPFVDQLVRLLGSGGQLHLATDWEPYAEHMLAVLNQCPGLVNVADDGGYAPRPATRPATKFERRGTDRGHPVRDLIFIKVDPGRDTDAPTP